MSANVDIYDDSTSTWSTAFLSQARSDLVATNVCGKAIFAGGLNNLGRDSVVVDIYDAATNTWTITALSQARRNIAATTVGDRAIFAGGYGMESGQQKFMNRVDIAKLPLNSPPTANAGQDITTDEGIQIMLDGSASTDPDGINDIVGYYWDFGDGDNGDGMTVNHVYTDNGEYTVTLTVTDSVGQTSADAAVVTVNNLAPTADFSVNPSSIVEGQSATLSFSNQYDPGSVDTSSGFIYSYDCTNDGVFEVGGVSNPDFVCIYPENGTFSVRGRIFDKDGGYTEYFVFLTVLNLIQLDYYLHGIGPNNNPPTLILDSISPISATEKYKDSTGVSFSGGNPWKEIGVWGADPSLAVGVLNNLGNINVWLGLKNSDDIGTRFDLKAEIYKNGELVSSSETDCIVGITRNPSQAKKVTGSFSSFSPVSFDGSSDILTLKILTRIGTDGVGGFCGGHSNAVGLRLYFDATDRPSIFGSEFIQ